MRINQKLLLAGGVMFLLFLISYKFSLYHESSQLSFLAQPVIPQFQRIITYLFMMIGIIPTILLMMYTSIFCHTINTTGVIQTICFDGRFVLSDSGGFFAYILASLISTAGLWFVVSALTSHKPVK